MAESQGFSDYDVSIAVVVEVMQIRTTESSSLDCNLYFCWFWRVKLARFLRMVSCRLFLGAGTCKIRTIFNSFTPCNTDALTSDFCFSLALAVSR
jgi:hypothetical protein